MSRRSTLIAVSSGSNKTADRSGKREKRRDVNRRGHGENDCRGEGSDCATPNRSDLCVSRSHSEPLIQGLVVSVRSPRTTDSNVLPWIGFFTLSLSVPRFYRSRVVWKLIAPLETASEAKKPAENASAPGSLEAQVTDPPTTTTTTTIYTKLLLAIAHERSPRTAFSVRGLAVRVSRLPQFSSIP